ncbi:MAG: PIN domain-containing protein [Planctomycetota bacterium]
MKPVFADTSFYIALVNPGDVHHPDALAYMRNHRGRVTTTDYVLIEVGNWLSRTGDRPSFVALMRQLETDPELTVVPGSRDLFERGYELYKARADKAWSLTDCISFVVMEQMGLSEALTADRHFGQAGFTVLLA